MQIDVYTEGANSFVEETEARIFREYFSGSFTSVKSLISDLDNYGEVTVHILDDNYGYVHGSDSIDAVPEDDRDQGSEVNKFSSSLLQSARTADALVVMLSKDAFLNTVVTQWNDVSDLSNPDSVWCLATSKKALGHVEVKPHLEQAVIVYHRSGVARIGTNAREALIKLISNDKPSAKEELYQEFGNGVKAHELLRSS